MARATAFYRSQLGDASVINYAYTDPPWRLMAKDIYYFFVYSWALPWVGLPLRPTDSGSLDELYPSIQNIWCMFVHLVLVVLQLGFVVSLPFLFIFPLWADALFVTGVLVLNRLLSNMLNGKDITYHSDEKYAKKLPEHEHEQWIFLNGVAVGQHWMKNNLNRLALTFGRPILGIHNRTDGIIFDVIECLVQRNFTFATPDVRVCYKHLKDVLYDPSKSKVVFIMHSQGGIMGGMVLDWLLQEMPQDLLAKLEVYTFGNAANHFNNPHRHVVSQSLAHTKPMEAMNTVMTETTRGSTPTTPVADTRALKGVNGISGLPQDSKPPVLKTESSASSSILSSRATTAAQDRAIGYIEHYAHTTDFVAVWGVLHFATNKMESPQLPRFLGRLFARSTERGGHQLNQHYLDGMFPLKRDSTTRNFIGVDEDSEFMNEVISVGSEGAAAANAREAFNITWAGTEGFGSGDISTPVEVHGLKKSLHKDKGEIRVKDLSRLWSYRNGRSPSQTPPLLMTEGGLVRNATI